MIKPLKRYNKFLMKKKSSWVEKKIGRHTIKTAVYTELFWHKWALINYGYSKRKMEE